MSRTINYSVTDVALETLAKTDSYGSHVIAYELILAGFNPYYPIKLMYMSNMHGYTFQQHHVSSIVPKNWNISYMDSDYVIEKEFVKTIEYLMFVRFSYKVG